MIEAFMAKRRAKLYEIPETTIVQILAEADLDDGNHELIKDIEGFRYSVKIIVSVENSDITVITCYPFKKGKKQ